MSVELLTIEKLERSVGDYSKKEVEQFMSMLLCQRLDEYLDKYGEMLASLTIDSAVEDIIQLKNVELDLKKQKPSPSPQSSSAQLVALRDQVVRLRAQKGRLEHELYRARSFGYLGGMFVIRVLEKLGLREPADVPR